MFVSCNILDTELYVSTFVSFMCMLFLLILYMWYFSNVFKCFPFLCVLIMSVASVMVSYVCPVFYYVTMGQFSLQLVHLMIASWAETHSVRIIGTDKSF
jgi:hypothetical protein